MGVAADLINKKGWDLEHYDFDDNWNEKLIPLKELVEIAWDGEEGCLPEDVREEIGLTEELQEELIQMNDKGKKFYQIARRLERELTASKKK